MPHSVSKKRYFSHEERVPWRGSLYFFIVVQSLSCVRLCDSMDCSTPGFPVLYYLLEFAQTHVHWVSDAIQPSHPLSSPSPDLHFSQHQEGWESALCIRWSKYWSLSFSISPSSEYSASISFRIDWWDFLAVQGTLKSLLQHHNSKESVLHGRRVKCPMS